MADDSAPVDVRVRFVSASPDMTDTGPPAYVSQFADRRGRPLAMGWELQGGAHLKLVMSAGAEFTLDRAATEISVSPHGADADEIFNLLVGPVLALALRLRGVIALHASANCVNGGALAFLGPSGAGKSTLAALFALKGYQALTDDLVALASEEDEWLIQSGVTYLRVRPGSIEAAAAALGRQDDLQATADAAYLDLSFNQHGGRPAVPLRVIYHLDSLSPDRAGTLRIDPVAGADALITLLGNTWATRWLDRSARTVEFNLLTRLSAQVAVRRVRIPGPRPAAEAIADAVLNDFHSFGTWLSTGLNHDRFD